MNRRYPTPPRPQRPRPTDPSQRSRLRAHSHSAFLPLICLSLVAFLIAAVALAGVSSAPSAALAAPDDQPASAAASDSRLGEGSLPVAEPVAAPGVESSREIGAPLLAPVGPVEAIPSAELAAMPQQSSGITDVAIRDDYFEPNVVTVTVGSIVRWTNRGQHAHSSTSKDGYWSWRLVPGASFGLRIYAPGIYEYHCIYHPDQAVTTTNKVVVVGDPQPTPTRAPGPDPAPLPEVDADTIVYDYFADEATRSRSDLFLVQPDGTDVRVLTSTQDLAEAQPAWSPDRSRVAYTASRQNAPGDAWNLWVMDLTTGQQRQITGGGDHFDPDWRPDGAYLAFTIIRRSGGVTLSSEIARITPDGGFYRPLVRVVGAGNALINPTWSPDGQRIAFSFVAGGNGGELYVMNADGTNIQRVYAHPGWNDVDPEWSPDGRYLAFSAGAMNVSPPVHDIWLLDLQTGTAGIVAQEPEWDLRRPAWSSDGKQLVFTARFQAEPARWALYTVPATGGTVNGPLALGVEPDWGSGARLPQVTPMPTPTGTPPEPATPPPFPTVPAPEPTATGPAPTFPPPPPIEPTPTGAVPGQTPTSTIEPSLTPGSDTTPITVLDRVYLPKLEKP